MPETPLTEASPCRGWGASHPTAGCLERKYVRSVAGDRDQQTDIETLDFQENSALHR